MSKRTPRALWAGRGQIILGSLLLLSACAPQPWVDSRREAGQMQRVGASTPDRPAICYDPGTSTAAQLQALADQECARTGRVARYTGVDRWQCTTATPHRAYYLCVAPSRGDGKI